MQADQDKNEQVCDKVYVVPKIGEVAGNFLVESGDLTLQKLPLLHKVGTQVAEIILENFTTHCLVLL